MKPVLVARHSLFFALLLVTPALAQQTAYEFSVSALRKEKDGDIPGAIADYDRAIALKPDKEELEIYYGARGNLKIAHEDFAGAIADCDQYIALQPDSAAMYGIRGAAKIRLGDSAGAIADFSKVIALEPKNATYYHFRGLFRRIQGDMDGAIADYGKFCELQPESMFGYYCRGIVRQGTTDFAGALADYDKAIALDKAQTVELSAYREITLRRLQHPTPFGELARAIAQWKDGWFKNVGLYLVDALSEQSFLARAGEGDAKEVPVQQCSAFYFAGVSRLLAGDRVVAQKYFEQSIATNKTGSIEFTLARGELARLTRSP